MAQVKQNTRQRADLGFAGDNTDLGADLDSFNPADWDVGTPAPKPPAPAQARQMAEAIGFRSREAGQGASTLATAPSAPATAPPKQLRRRRTGRNAQFNLKARPDTIEDFCAVADAKGWGLGETLEHAVALLRREYGNRQP